MDQVYTFAGMILRSYAGWALVFVMLTLIERVFAKEPNPVASRFAGVIFWAIWIPISFATAAGLMALWKAAGIGPLLSIDAVRMLGWAGPFAVAGAIFLSVLVGDFLTYWFHRIQHAWLWRFHAVHHSIR
jgi:sterol desaturase/sphingolipid hydroxylase (fatty acid hydroxylase superfamily)